MKYRMVCPNGSPQIKNNSSVVEFPDMRHDSLSEAEYEYQELLSEEDFSLERFRYSLTLTMLLWLVLFAAWGITRLHL